MRNARVWQRLLGVARIVIEGVGFDEDADAIVVSVRPRQAGQAGAADGAAVERRGMTGVRVDAAGGTSTSVSCAVARGRRTAGGRAAEHGPTVIQVPWARHGAGHTRAFDDQVAWLAVHTSKTAVTELMRVAWRTVGAIVTRVVAEARAGRDPFDGLVRIGIDEISYKRGHRYLTVVVDHDSGRPDLGGAGP